MLLFVERPTKSRRRGWTIQIYPIASLKRRRGFHRLYRIVSNAPSLVLPSLKIFVAVVVVRSSHLAPPPADEDFDFFALNKKEERQPLRFDDDEVDGLENKRSFRRRANASSFSSSFEWTQEEEEKQRAAADW